MTLTTQPTGPLPSAEDGFFETSGIRVLRALRRIMRAVDIHSRKLQSEYQTTAPQMICLYTLVRRETMTLSELANQVSLGMSTVNGIIDRLAARGLVKRERSECDRRKVNIAPTEAGRLFARRAPALLQDRLSAALRTLPQEEQDAIAASLERVVELMGVENLDAAPHLLPGAQIQENNTKEA